MDIMKDIVDKRILNKEELIEKLKCYKLILSPQMYEYLMCLIQLEFSVVREYINDAERKMLAELKVYENILLYNIYQKAFNMIDENSLWIDGFNDSINPYFFRLISPEIRLDLFNFDYSLRNIYQSNYDISIYQVLEGSQDSREKEILRIMNQLEQFDSERAFWDGYYSLKMEKLKGKIQQLDGKVELSDVEKKIIDISKRFYGLLMEDYGLTEDSFGEYKDEETNLTLFPTTGYCEKSRVKKMPKLTIKHNIRYL